MLYEEYAQLDKGKQSRAAAVRLEWQEHQQDQGRLLTGKTNLGGSPSERPYVADRQSFSRPQINISSQQHRNSHDTFASSSTESLSPSNSASQNGLRPKQRQDGGYGSRERLTMQMNHTNAGIGSSGGEKRPEIVKGKLTWTPTYMKRRVILAFITVLGILVVLLEYIFSLSGRLLGLGPIDGARYIWQMAPPATLLVVVGFWHRLEYQARSTAPWLRMSRGPADAERTLLLDYVSMSRPMVAVRALKNKDWIVAGAVIVSMLLWTAVVVSTGAITTVLVTMTDSNVKVQLTGQFAQDGKALGLNSRATPESKATSLLKVAGLQLGELTAYPDGVTNWFAYETFNSTDLSPGTHLTAPVRALFPNLTCEPASLSVNSVMSNEQEQVLHTTLIAPGCAVEMTINGTGLASVRGAGSPTYFLRSSTGGCYGSTALKDQRIVVAFGVANIQNGVEPGFRRIVAAPAAVPLSTQIICRPGYTIRSVGLVRNSDRTVQIELGSSDPSKALPSLPGIHPWDLAAAMANSFKQDVPEVVYLLDQVIQTDALGYPGFKPARVMIDPCVHFALGFRIGENGFLEAAEEFLDSNKLSNMVVNYYHHHASLAAHSLILRRPGQRNSSVTGTSVMRSERIGANAAGVHFAAVLMAVSGIVASVIFFLVPTQGFLPRNPNTLIDTAALLGHSNVLLHAVRGAGGADSKILWNRLSMAYFYTGTEAYERGIVSDKEGYFKVFGGPLPPITRPPEYFEHRGGTWAPHIGLSAICRVLGLFITFSLIIVLEMMLRASSTGDGLGTMSDDTWTQLIWNVLPAAILVCLAFYIGLVDTSIRQLTPFMALASGKGTFKTMTINFLDLSIPRILFHAAHMRDLPVILSTLTWTMAALLPIVVAATFDMRATVFEAGDTAPQVQRRLRQDEGATRVLQLLLSLILAGSVALWVLTPRHKVGILPRLRSSPLSIASIAAMFADGNVMGMLGRAAEWKTLDELQIAFRDGLHVTMRFRIGWDKARGRARRKQDAFGISAIRTGGWGGGENVGLGMQARVGYRQKRFVRDWGWKP